MNLTLAVLLISYFALHSVLANEKVKHFFHSKLIAPQYYRLFYNLLAIGLLIPILGYYLKLPSVLLFQTPIWLISASYVMIIIGMIFLLLALKQYNIGEFSGVDAFQKTKNKATLKLQKDGFNSIVRHPLYFSMLIIFWFIFLVNPTDKLLVLAIIATLYIFLGTKLEERKLLKTFGEEYLVYQKKVPMLLPSFSIFKMDNTSKE